MENFQQFPNLLIDRRNIMSYEEAIKELENIIERLEKEQLPLSTAQELFERANTLSKFAQEELSKATGKLFQIKKDLDQITEEEI